MPHTISRFELLRKPLQSNILFGMTRARNPKQTRQAVLTAAYEKILRHGFQSAGLNDILKETGVTKGALYHHFPNKMALGYAVIEEPLREHIEEWWLKPLEEGNDPIENLARIIQNRMSTDEKFITAIGCPLSNLTQEMSGVDNGFRLRLEATYRLWRKGLAKALTRGQMHGYVTGAVEVDKAAAFIIAALQGAVSQAKAAQNLDSFQECLSGLSHYLTTLRP